MKVNYQYASPSMCVQNGKQTTLGLSPDLSREEKVSFLGKVKNPLVFRDAMLMLREIVVSDMSNHKKERVEFFAWLEEEIQRRMLIHNQYLPGVREDIQENIDKCYEELENNDKEIKKLIDIKSELKKEIDSYDSWKDYYKIERDFWKFLKERDMNLWWVLDPVITVHPDQVSFEAFSLDESTYGCLSIDMSEFELLQKPSLGTTNIDFSAKLAQEMKRFRTYSNVELSVNPEGFTVDTGVMPEHIEKKIDLPETWIKGFNQVSSAASLEGIEIELSPVDMYDICSFLRRNKAKTSPRYMKWILEPGKNIRIVFEPFKKELVLRSIYKGEKKREEKIWGRRRWLVIEKLIPVAKSFKVKLLGFGMPQFIIGDLGNMKMTIGFTSWSANDWVKGTAFNILGGFVGDGNYEEVYKLLKEKRVLSLDEIYKKLNDKTKAGVGMLFRKGEGYYDAVNNKVRFRKLCNSPIPKELYKVTDMEMKVQSNLEEGLNNFTIKRTENNDFIIKSGYNIPNPKYRMWSYRNTEEYDKKYNLSETEIKIDEEGQISEVKCNCREFNKGARNISEPCSHILALYLNCSKFLKLDLKPNKEYKINDIVEMLL